MLELKNVSKFYYNKGVIASGFSKINLKLDIGEFVVITGESGSGKSTLLNVLSGLDSYEEGEMYINGEETSHYAENDFEEYRKQYVGNIFQNFNLVNSYTVYQNIELVMLLNGYKKREVKKKIIDIINKVDLYKFRNTKVSKLSGGQKQRVAIARAIAKNTPIIVADEPTGNLDTESAKKVLELLSNVAKDKLVIVVTHNFEQVEKYATRVIKMYDGKIIEDKKIKEIENVLKINMEGYKNISIWNKIRLGVRNTFNIKTKFLLIFAVFLFIIFCLISQYTTIKQSNYEQGKLGYNSIFNNTDEKRIVIKKNDGTAFSSEDYNNIKSIDNVDYLIEKDILLDNQTILESEEGSLNLYGNSLPITLNENVDLGRMPQDDYEIVIKGEKDDYFLKEDLLNQTVYMIDNSGNLNKDYPIKIVGIKFEEEETSDFVGINIYYSSNGNYTYYVSDALLQELSKLNNQQYSTTKVLFQDKYISYDFAPNSYVPSGYAYVSSDFNNLCTDGNCQNKNIVISAENIYYTDSIALKIKETYSKNTLKSLTGITDYDASNGIIFINADDYNSLFNKASYQSSVFVKNIDNIDKTASELEKLGLKTLAIKNTLVNEDAGLYKIVILIQLGMSAVLIVVVLFISYFIISIILKSRNIYFTTMRILGANRETSKTILDIELFLNSTLAYIFTLIIAILTKFSVINWEYLKNLMKFLKPLDYIAVYVILIIISQLISMKFAKKLFKKSAMKTIREEV